MDHAEGAVTAREDEVAGREKNADQRAKQLLAVADHIKGEIS